MNKLIKLLSAFIPNKRWRHYLRQYFSDGGPGATSKSSKTRLYYCTEKNFGDMLNLDVMRYLGCPCIFSHARFAELCGIGSMMEGLLLSSKQGYAKHPIHVYGTGFIKDSEQENEQFFRPVVIHALRGKKSLERCEKILGRKLPDVVLGDPGLLVRKLFPRLHVEKKYDVGIICHIADNSRDLEKHLSFSPALKTKMLDITQPPDVFVPQLAECRFILSSAMHGLICADALEIPNAHIVIGEGVIGGEYKFRDYYSVFPNVNYSPVYLKNLVLTDDDIERLKEAYHVPSKEIDDICTRLIEAFPKMLSQSNQ